MKIPLFNDGRLRAFYLRDVDTHFITDNTEISSHNKKNKIYTLEMGRGVMLSVYSDISTSNKMKK